MVFGSHRLPPTDPSLALCGIKMGTQGVIADGGMRWLGGLLIAKFKFKLARFVRLLLLIEPGQQGDEHPILDL